MRRTRIEVPAAGMIMRRVAQVAMSALICCTLAAPLGATENRGRPRAPKAEREGHLARQRHLAQQHHRLSEAQMQKRAEHQRKGKPFRALVSLRVALEHGTQGHSHEQAAIKADAEQNQHKLTPDKQARAESRLARIAKEKQKLEEAAGTLDTLLVIALLHKMNLEPLEGVGGSNEHKFEGFHTGLEKGRVRKIPQLRLPATRIMDLAKIATAKPRSEPLQTPVQRQLEADNGAGKVVAFPSGALIRGGTPVALRPTGAKQPGKEITRFTSIIPGAGRKVGPVLEQNKIVPFSRDLVVYGAPGTRSNKYERVEEWIYGPYGFKPYGSKAGQHGSPSGAGGAYQRPETTSTLSGPAGERADNMRRQLNGARSLEVGTKMFNRFATKYHPDKYPAGSAEQAAAETIFSHVSEFWSVRKKTKPTEKDLAAKQPANNEARAETTPKDGTYGP